MLAVMVDLDRSNTANPLQLCQQYAIVYYAQDQSRRGILALRPAFDLLPLFLFIRAIRLFGCQQNCNLSLCYMQSTGMVVCMTECNNHDPDI